jgi:hypothetical protein
LAPPAAQDDFRGGNLTDLCSGFHRSRDILKLPFPDLVVSTRKLRLADAIACVRMKQQEANQNLGFTSRPFVLCGLPVKRPRAGQLLHERRNGHFLLQVTGHPSYGLPWCSATRSPGSNFPHDFTMPCEVMAPKLLPGGDHHFSPEDLL